MLPTATYTSLLDHIGQAFTAGRQRAYAAVNQQSLEAYWNIGRHIVEYEQEGQDRAFYGQELLKHLSKDLTLNFGRGFSKTHLYQMRQFYALYPIFQSLTGKLSWTHYGELIGISKPLARSFYEQQSIAENWSVRQLKRQVQSALFGIIIERQNKKI